MSKKLALVLAVFVILFAINIQNVRAEENVLQLDQIFT
jgi:hypothetical protein